MVVGSVDGNVVRNVATDVDLQRESATPTEARRMRGFEVAQALRTTAEDDKLSEKVVVD